MVTPTIQQGSFNTPLATELQMATNLLHAHGWLVGGALYRVDEKPRLP
jgi:hypothetical protein